jgi:4-amino-4-deoxy-L-arabinose transferase-like glycosyltransferase
MAADKKSPFRLGLLALGALALVALVLWQRWPTFGFRLWNVDEAIHAAAARTILDGGVLYRDAIDQRTPLTYYAVAGVFALCGENNLWALRCGIALLIATTAGLLGLAGWRLRGPAAGGAAALLFALLSSSVLSAGDAYAAGTEWFVAFFSSAAAAVFFGGAAAPSPRRLFVTGLLAAGAFLSKQPALLDLAAPAAALAYLAWRRADKIRGMLPAFAALAAGWLTPVLVTAGYFAAKGALADGIFYAWTYNVAYYGPEVTTADRLGSLAVPFQLIGRSQPWLLALWVVGAFAVLHRLLQRNPTPAEAAANPGAVFVAAWSLSGLAGAAAGGRGFDHYSIQFLAPFCLGAGLVLSWLFHQIRPLAARPLARAAGVLLLAAIVYGAGAAAVAARQRTLPEDPSVRISAYIREHSAATDRIFVWGYHPDIYLYADRRPASRFLYGSFLSGLIPWTNTAPERDTRYAIVPGAMETLLQELTARPPVFIVDCSAGPNRFWQKYPLEKFPALRGFIARRYQVTEGGWFVPQGFRLYRLMSPAEQAAALAGPPPLPAAVSSTLKIGTVSAGLAPVRASAPNGANLAMADGRLEYFAHAPSSLVYRIPAGAGALRGGFGIRPGAYAPENKGPTDGAEFIIRWRPDGGGEHILLRRLLRPRDEPADRPVQSFRVEWSPDTGGELELAITPGPTDNNASDWTFWTDLVLENFH